MTERPCGNSPRSRQHFNGLGSKARYQRRRRRNCNRDPTEYHRVASLRCMVGQLREMEQRVAQKVRIGRQTANCGHTPSYSKVLDEKRTATNLGRLEKSGCEGTVQSGDG
jgi:hypothetical protein